MDLIDKYLTDDKSKKLFHQERVILEVTEAICQYMTAHNISRSELARRLGKEKSFVSQVLNGERNLTLRTIADITWAIGCDPRVKLVESGTPREDERTEWKRWSRERLIQKKLKDVKIIREAKVESFSAEDDASNKAGNWY